MPVTNETAEIFRNFTRLGDRPIAVVEHSWYGRMWAPTDLEEFSRVIDHLAWQSPGGWRGQANLEWKLDSGAARRLRLVERDVSEPEAVVADYERTLLHRARLNGWGVHAGRELGDLELLARLQHHGAATRLLDFTRSVYVALWFAASQQPELWGLLIGLDLMDVWTIDDPATVQLPMADVVRDGGERLGVWHPSALSPRLPAQAGFFLWGRTVGVLGELLGGTLTKSLPLSQSHARFLRSCASRFRQLSKRRWSFRRRVCSGLVRRPCFRISTALRGRREWKSPAVVLACGQQRLPARHAAIE